MLSKADLWTETDLADQVADWNRTLGDSVLGIIPVSSATGTGLPELTEAVVRFVPKEIKVPAVTGADGIEVDFEAEHLTYKPRGEGGYSVEREPDGAFRIHGNGVKVLFDRFDMNNDEALGYLETRLIEMGVMSELKRAGFEPGNEIRVGDYEFELY